MKDVVFHSTALNRDMPYRVFLPEHIEAGTKFPVIYLLHGGNGSFRDWSNDSTVSSYAAKGLILVMPDSMSIERRRLMAAYGATFELTPRAQGMKGAIARAQELVAQNPNAWMPQQFENESNIEVHKRTTAQEIFKDFPEGLDYIITGVGTGGHITACAEVLKPKWPKLKVLAVEPVKSPVISGGQPGRWYAGDVRVDFSGAAGGFTGATISGE